MKRVKTQDDKNKSRGGWRINSEPVEKKNTYIMEKEQIQMYKKRRKKNDVMSNIVYITKAYICLYVYIFITSENYVLQHNMYLYS